MGQETDREKTNSISPLSLRKTHAWNPGNTWVGPGSLGTRPMHAGARVGIMARMGRAGWTHVRRAVLAWAWYSCACTQKQNNGLGLVQLPMHTRHPGQKLIWPWVCLP